MTEGWTLLAASSASGSRDIGSMLSQNQLGVASQRHPSQPHSIVRRVRLLLLQSSEGGEEDGLTPQTSEQQPLPSDETISNVKTTKTKTTTTTSSTAMIAPPEILFGDAADNDDDGVDDIVDDVDDDDETPAGIVGAQFFGGNKQKEELYDPVAEMEASVEEWVGVFDRFATTTTTTTTTTTMIDQEVVGPLCQSLQQQLLQALQRSDVTKKQLKQQQQQLQPTRQDLSSSSSSPPLQNYYYSPNLVWETPFATTNNNNNNVNNNNNNNPLQALQQAKDFYKRLDVGIVSGEQISNDQIDLRWEISVAWPTLWEPRVILTGSSRLTVDVTTRTILRQTDTLDCGSNNMLQVILDQLLPRFWDLYHIGMTPSAELAPRIVSSSSLLPKSYQVSELPSRWVLQPTRFDTGDREDAVAQVIPNHAFSSVIKTVGPQRERYVPTSPIQVQIVQQQQQPTNEQQQQALGLMLQPRQGSVENGDLDDAMRLATTSSSSSSSPTSPLILWKIPLSVEFMSQARWPLPGEDPEADEGSQPTCQYVLEPRRRIATVPFGKSPQDPEVAQARKRLYEAVMRDGTYKPKLDVAGRPQFFYLQHDCKACFTADGGLGMSVYEYRPEWSETNEIGIELEL